MKETKKNPSEPDLWTWIALLGHKKHRKYWNTRVDDIRKSLEKGADPNAGRGAPLTLAVTIGHIEIVRVLLEHGADVHGGCTYRTPLLFAENHSDIKACLLEHGAKESLFTAVAEGNVDKIEGYLTEDPSLVHLRDEEDMTPLFFAAAMHNLAVMTLLLQAGADPNAVAVGSYGITPIHQVCRSNQYESREAIGLLVKYGVNLNARNEGGVTALHMAVRDRNVEAVRVLLECGADPDIEDRGRGSTPLRRAVANTGRQGTGGKTHHAIEITKLLLAFGANPNHINRSGKTIVESTRNSAIRALLNEAAGKR